MMMRNVSWVSATTTGEVWIETWGGQGRGHRWLHVEDILTLNELFCRRVNPGPDGTRTLGTRLFGHCLLASQPRAQQHPDTKLRTSLPGKSTMIISNP